MSDVPRVSIREVTDPRDPAIERFGKMQTAAYFAPETLIPGRYIPQLLRGDSSTSTRRNFLLVAEVDDRVVGGTLFHWLEQAGVGFSSFLGVERAFRRQSIARRLHQQRLATLDSAAGHEVRGVFIDVVNPSRMPPEALAREAQLGDDPWTRRRAFGRLGFRQVDIRYEQPVGGPHGGPVTILDLLYFARHPTDTVRTGLVVNTMRAYWSPWLGERAAYYAEQLRTRAGGKTELALIAPDAGA